MKKGYRVVDYSSCADESAVRTYGTLAVAAVESFGGRGIHNKTKILLRTTSQCRMQFSRSVDLYTYL